MGKIKIYSRPDPNKLPEFQLPLHIRSAGANESTRTWKEFFPAAKKNFVQVFWTEKGAGEITLRDRKIIVKEGDFFYHLPGDDHAHRTVGEVWNYRWFTMDGALAEPFMRDYGYKQEPHCAGECPVNLFTELETLLSDRTAYAQRHALAIAAEILALAGKEASETLSQPDRYFFHAVEQRLSDPTLSCEVIAEELGMHRTTFTRIFKEKTHGMTPKQYLKEARFLKTMRLLRESTMLLKEIAQECGISSCAYLCRLIRERTGSTPLEIRRNIRASGKTAKRSVSTNKVRRSHSEP